MASKLQNIGYAVRRLFGANFDENEVEEIGATDNRIWTNSKIVDSDGDEITESNPLPVEISDGTDQANVDRFSQLETKDKASIDLLSEILYELKKINLHLQTMTDEEIK